MINMRVKADAVSTDETFKCVPKECLIIMVGSNNDANGSKFRIN